MPGWLDPSATRVRLKEAQEEEARAAFAAELKAVEAEHLALRRELDELKRELMARRAAWEREAEAARIRCDIAWERFVETYKRYAAQQKADVDRKWDGQPHTELGRFDFGKKPKLGLRTTGENTSGDEGESASATPEEIIATAKRENLAARPDKYMKCLDLCYPLWNAESPRAATSIRLISTSA